MTRIARFARFALSILAVAATASGCGHTKKGVDEQVRDTRIQIPPAWAKYRPGLQLSPLMAIDAQLGADIHTIENAARILAIDCMRKRGFDYRPTIEPVKPRDALAAGDLDPAVTARDGYTISPHIDGGMTKAEEDALPESKYEATLSKGQRARYYAALLGVDGPGVKHPRPGCLGKARRQASGGAEKRWTDLSYVVPEQGLQVDEKVRATERWHEADAKWSRCMKRRGFDYDSPEDAVNDAYERFNVEHRKTPSKAERALATADARCRLHVDFVRLTIELSEPFERKALTRIEPQVLAWMAERDRVLTHVEAEVAKAGR